jgi:hypothetical protein
MDAFWQCFELSQSFIRFCDAPQLHRPPHDPTIFHRAIFVYQSLHAGQAFRPIRASIIITPQRTSDRVQRSVPDCAARRIHCAHIGSATLGWLRLLEE